ncbi:MAG: ATP phosphoribosyltransferase [Synergistales bacterium 54_9]|nr:MAG: ATP phosphoribosyltransferase [Synergistales bacterium 54_9]
MLTLALPTGRMLSVCQRILEKLGMPCEKLENRGRSLVIEEEGVHYLLAKPMDVPAYVHYGAADVALAGSDVIQERGGSLVEIADTGEGRCRIVVAGPPEMEERFMGHESGLMGLRIATKYPVITNNHFASRGIQPEIINLHGSIELAPLLGLSDCIVDIVQTGSTLKANRLRVLEDVAPVSLRIVASRKSTQTNWDQLNRILFRTRQMKGGYSHEHAHPEENQ